MSIHSTFDQINSILNIEAPKMLDESCFKDFKSSFEIKNALIKPKIYQVDLKETVDINSTGLLLILTLFHFARDHHAKVSLINIQPQVKRFLIENQYNDIVELS